MKKIIDFALKPLSTLNPQQKQSYIYYGCISCAVILVFTVIWNLAFASTAPRTTRGAAPTEKVLTGASRLNPQDAWNERMNNQFDIQEKEMAELKKMVKQLTDKKNENKEEAAPTHKENSVYGTQVRGQPTHHPVKAHTPSVLDVSLGATSTSPSHVSPQGDLKDHNPADKMKRFRSKGISKQQIALHNSKIGKSLDTVDNTIPPGSFAQGVLLSGVDASTSTSASANPEPVLIELTDSGDLSRYFTSTVNGCRVTASSYGVLSKERVMMRLEKLSCIEVATGEVMTTEVDGYVSGEDGKLGLRGTVVDRAGDHVRAAMLGGFLSSFGNFLAASSNPVTFASQTGLAQITPMHGSELMKHGAAKGASGALDKYTEFYIKRAEQLEPVIQIGAGRIVQVVFNKSVGIAKSAIKQTISARNDKSRTQTLETVRTNEHTAE
jgi:hypothetical protein